MRGWTMLVLLSACTMLLPLLGCEQGAKDLPDLVPVSGSVKLDGEPLKGAMVTFSPTGNTRGVGGAGLSDESGRYELKTRGVDAGVPVGEYQVTCSKLVMPDGSDIPPGTDDALLLGSGTQQVVPVEYTDPQATKLTATVPAGGATIDFELTSK
ncbi:MAG: carboxypeptidase-like regulatory domain-containing protein [Planctomycetota bacterium]